MDTVKSELWDGGESALLDAWGNSEHDWNSPWKTPQPSATLARRLLAWESLQLTANAASDPAEPYSLPWFLHIEKQRHGKMGRWIPKILEFTRHRGETLLGLGDGLGTDWAQYAQNGASVIVCSTSDPQLSVVRRNFEVRGLVGRFIHAHPAHLPFDSDSIDVVCLSALHKGIETPADVIAEVYRVLKPGGKMLVVAPSRYDVVYWSRVCFFWTAWFTGKRSEEQRPEPRFSGRDLRELCERFVEHRIHKRHLRRGQVPHLWRWIPISWLARIVGTVMVLKAFKPLPMAKGLE